MSPLTKQTNFRSAVLRLRESVAEYQANPASTTLRDGVIQRFEFTFELAWKSLKEYMEDQGSTASLQFPKQVLKEAYAAGIISGEALWLDMLSSRNITSHIYSDSQAAAVMTDVANRYLSAFTDLSNFYQ